MSEFIINLKTAIHALSPLERLCILSVVFLFLMFGFNAIIQAHYNAKKFSIKIVPIIITAIIFGILMFLCLA